MKKVYEKPQADVISFVCEDVITVSTINADPASVTGSYNDAVNLADL